EGRALPSIALAVPDAGPHPVGTDRDAADATAVARDPGGEGGQVVGERAEAVYSRGGVPGERLVAERNTHAGRSRLARPAHDQAVIADGGREDGRVALEQREVGQLLAPGEERRLGHHARMVLRLDPLEPDDVAPAVDSRRGGVGDLG